MATAEERELLHEKAEYLRNAVTTWVHGPREDKVRALADELDVIAGEKEAPASATGPDSGEGDAPA